METVACPHCGAQNTAGAAFCAGCGKALPLLSQTGPRIVTGNAVATTSAGLKLQTDQLHQQAKRASGALLAVAIIQTVLGGIVVALLAGTAGARAGGPALMMLLVPVMGVAAIFWGLYIWSRRNPLPAAIVGLVVYVSLWALDVVAAIAAAANDPGGTGPGAALNRPTNGLFMRIIIVVILARAISAGVQHRKLLRQQAAAAAPVAPLPL